VRKLTLSDFELSLTKILTAFASGMRIVTGTKTRVCIKLLKVEGGVDALLGKSKVDQNHIIYADLFVNDSDSIWPKKDYSPPHDKDRLSLNSAFCNLLEGKGDYYLENNLPKAFKKGLCKNSSIDTYAHGRTGKGASVLPYRSTILWPIRKLQGEREGDPHRDLLRDKHDLLGFLCIDSASRNVWSDRYDSEVGAAVADLLYAFLDAWYIRRTEKHPANP
jgi:hypothetical protein